MAKNELVKAGSFNLMVISGNMAEAVSEEMDGLGALSFDRVKIPAGGGIAFELPGEDEENPESSPSIVGVILDHHPVNAYWAEKFTGGNAQPDCSSLDGKKGVIMATGELRECASCPHNQFGSDGRGKACKNIHRLYILREGNPVPLLLPLPPSSLKALRDYIGKKILLKGLRCYQAITKITLKKETNADGIVYSRAVFSFQDTLTEQQQAQIEGMRAMIKTVRQQVDIDSDDYTNNSAYGGQPAAQSAPAPAPTVDANGFMDIPEGAMEDLPFN